MARSILVLALVCFAAAINIVSAANSSAGTPASSPLGAAGPAMDNNVIGTTDSSATNAAPVGGPVPDGAFSNVSPAPTPASDATTMEVSGVAGVVATAVAGALFF